MNLSSKQIEKILKKYKRIIVVLLSIIVFFVFLYNTFISNNEDGTSSTTVDTGILLNTYQNYKNSVSDVEAGVRELLDNAQIQQIISYGGFFDDLDEYETRDNPFVSF